MIYIYFLLINFLIPSQGDFYIDNGLNNKDNLVVAQKYFKQAITSYLKEENEVGLSNAYYYLGYTYELNSDYTESIKNYNISKNYAIQNKIYKNQFRTNERLSIIFKSLNIFSKSLYYLNKNKELLESDLNESNYINRNLYHLAEYYYYINNFERSNEILSEINSNHIPDLTLQYNNLYSLNYNELGNKLKAEEYYIKLFKLYPDQKIVLANIARFYYSIDDIEKSKKYFSKLIKLNSLPNINDENVNKLLVSDLYFKYGDYQTAHNVIEEIIPYFTSHDIYDRLLEALKLKKKIYYKLEKTNEIEALDSIIYDVKDKQVKAQIDINSKVILALNEIELENKAKEDELILYKVILASSIIIILILIVVAILVNRNRQIKISFDNINIDKDLKIHLLHNIVLFELNKGLHRFTKYLHLNYDFEDHLDLYENFEEIVETTTQLVKVVKDEPIESPLDLDIKVE